MKFDFLSHWLLLLQGYFLCLAIKGRDDGSWVAYLITVFVLMIVEIVWSNRTIKKTSEQWQKENPDIKVIDPDGWDRNNFDWSWGKEKISLAEYKARRMRSTCMGGMK